MKFVRNRVVHIILTVLIAAVIIAVCAFYMSIITGAVHDNTMDNVREMAKHDQSSINTFVEHNWDFLERIGRRLHREEYTSVKELQVNLIQEREESSFDYIYLISDDGRIYTDTFIIKDGGNDFLSHFKYGDDAEGGEDKSVFRYALENGGRVDEYIVYAINLNALTDTNNQEFGDLVIDGVNMCALCGFSKVSSIQTGMVIENFISGGVSRGYSAVVDKAGDYIVDPARTGYLNQINNLYEYIDSCDKSELTSDEIRQKMENGDVFSFSRVDRNENNVKTERLFYFMPFENDSIEWYFIMSVDDAVFAEQSARLIVTNIVELAIVVVILIAALLVIMVMQNRAVKAVAKEKAQGEFLSNMSHEIRTPLNGLIGLNYLVLKSIDDNTKTVQIKEWLKKSHSTANYLLSLVNDVLDMSKLQAGKVEILQEPLLVETLVDAIWSMQRDNIESHGVRFITDVNVTEPCIIGDEVRIKQVLMNIVGNAAKFTPKGGYIRFSVSQSAAEDGRVTTTFVCEDTGVGMSKEFVGKIFESFSQERSKIASSIKGTGLGMAISKLLVDAMGGTITVESELGKGSKFTVAIPAATSSIPEYMQVTKEEGEKDMAARSAQAAGKKPVKVLVAEDNELNAEILLEVLEEAGFEPVHAADGKQALELFEKSEVGEYDIILMDMRMPEMDGCTAAQSIRALDRPDAATVTIFACTANTFAEDRAQAMQSGMNDFLTKPIDIKIFLQKLESVGLNRPDAANKKAGD